jgi:hypothetical protein
MPSIPKGDYAGCHRAGVSGLSSSRLVIAGRRGRTSLRYLIGKIRAVGDLYDGSRYEGSRKYYTKRNPLTAQNKLSPPIT